MRLFYFLLTDYVSCCVKTARRFEGKEVRYIGATTAARASRAECMISASRDLTQSVSATSQDSGEKEEVHLQSMGSRMKQSSDGQHQNTPRGKETS